MVWMILVFFIVIAVEAAYSKAKGLRVYYLPETLSHFSTGIGQIATNVFAISASLWIYTAIYDRFALFRWNERSLVAILVVFFLADFAYYLVHRMAHRVNLFIAAHAVHHQAQDFNHASALRQSATSRLIFFSIYLPLAVLGVPVTLLSACILFNTFIQFFSHNGVITRKLGFLEHAFVTPRTHRVHHGVNEPYLDRNFGGVFIFWDRLFGTFQDLDEKIPMKIGAMDEINYYDPIRANLDYYGRILFVAHRKKTAWGKVAVWFGTPENLAEDLSRFGYVPSSERPVLGTIPRSRAIVVSALLVIAFAVTVALMIRLSTLSWMPKLAGLSFVIAVLWSVGQILSNRPLVPSVLRKSA